MMNLAKQRVLVFVLLAILRFGATEGDSNLCAHRDVRPSSTARTSSSSSSSSTKSSSDDLFRNWGGEVQDDNLTIRCHSNIYCFTLWTSDAHNKSKVNVLKQGCWIGEPNVCMQGSCVSSMAPKNNSHFCCCSGDMCNLNFTDGYDPTAHTTTPFVPSQPLQDHNYKIKTVIISLVSVFSVALVIIVAYFGYRMCTRPKHPSIESLHAPESPPVQPEFDMNDLKLCSIISKGRYAEVWKGKLEDRDVAVKIYSSHYREYYNNERTLYRLPFMDYEGLVRFYGADERITQEGSAQLMIVMSYVPLGSLNSYLKNNTLDWPTMVHMAYSVAKALSHLHTDIQKGDLFKPVLAHRDLNTRNILVRSDLTCIIADLGFAVATVGSKLIKRGHAEIAEQTSLTDVGTLRYMAPELLDGAVNLRDCEASLKQIDIYALGLVLWEISSRCVDLYQGAPLPEYAPPFQAEVGSNPTFEEMQMLVVRAKKRPKFPEVWKETNQAVRSLKETIEECWDADAEARLTALCVEERLSDLPNLWAHEIKHRGVTPTLNAMINVNETTTTTTTTSDKPLTAAPSDLQPPHATHNLDNDDTTVPLLGNGHVRNGQSSRSLSASASHSWLQQENSMSTGTTDTILPITPVDSSSVPVKASNLIQERNSTVLRPHTGRNPTVERNTHKRSDEELRVSGNTLVSSAFPDRRDSLSTQSAPPEQPSAESPPDYMSDGPETSLVQNDALSHRNPPIPYVQNQVHGDVPAGRPKVANTTSLRGYARGERSFREKLSRLIRPKEFSLKLSSFSLFGGGRRHDYSRAQDMEVEDFQQEPTNIAGRQQAAAAHHVSNLDQGQSMSQHSNLHPIDTEVHIQNGSVVTRPTNLVLSNQRSLRDAVGQGCGARDSTTREESNARDSVREGSSARDSVREETSSKRSTREGLTLSRDVGAANGVTSRDSAVKTGSQSDSTDDVFTETVQAQLAAPGQHRYPENRLRFAEVGVAKLHIPAVSQQPVRRLQGHSKSTSELLHLNHRNHNSDSCWQETELSAQGEDHAQRRRPNSLSLKGHNYSPVKPLPGKKSSKPETAGSSKPPSKHKLSSAAESSVSKLKGSDRAPAKSGTSAPTQATPVEGMCAKGGGTLPASLVRPEKMDDSGEKIRRRVKTPVRPSKKSARLSLYDDRLMSSELNCVSEGKMVDASLRKSLTSSKLASNNNNNNNNNSTELVEGVKGNPSTSAVSARGCLPSQHAQLQSAICSSDSNVVV